ncbi:hypothetical protein [Microbacterium sp.]|uniref:hypothetical protein n=1 Tax=Microbacterium sp. TaxID=51671 RepID=UPI003569F9F4
MPEATSIRSRLAAGIGAVAVSALLALTACAPAPESQPTPTPSAATETPAPEPYAGPALFVGDELNWFMLSPDEISSVLPASTDIGAASSVLTQISDGWGPDPVPAICTNFLVEESLGTVGSRNMEWRVNGGGDQGYGHLLALQFADEAHAQGRMDQLIAMAEQCSTFDFNGPASFESVVPEPADGVRAMAGTLQLPEIEGGGRGFSAFASVGNVLVELWQTQGSGDVPDARAIAELLQDRAAEARATLIEELTANPPTVEEEPAIDGGAPWSDWEIAFGGVGPIRLGDPIDTALSAAEGAQTVAPEYEQGPWRIVNADGSASMLIQPSADGSTAASITVGNARSLEGMPQNTASLPSAGGIRVGAPVADAIAAFPGGTTVTVSSSGDDWYDVATRDGRLLRFHADRDVVDDGAVIVGVQVEDATLRTFFSFG